MPNAMAEIAEPRVEIKPSTTSRAVLVPEALEAIGKAFPYEGELRVRYLWSGSEASHFRANWFRPVEGDIRVTCSLFISITRTPDGLVVRDNTNG